MGRIKRWVPVIVWAALIFVLSAQSQLPTPGQRLLDIVVEKSAHTFEYAVLAALLVRALDPGQVGRRRALWGAVFLTWLYALTDELHQAYVPGRTADWVDIAFDWTGALAGASLCLYVWTVRRGGTLSEQI